MSPKTVLPDFRQRSQLPELMDAPDMAASEIWKVLSELDVINLWLGGHQITLQALTELLSPGRHWHLLDVGCGGGDHLRRIAAWGQKQGLNLSLTGLDLNQACLDYARQHTPPSGVGAEIHWVQGDYRDWTQPVDLVISTLFCHHLDPEQFRDFLLWTKATSRYAFVINDLHRHPLAWHSIRLLTRLLSRSKLVRYDAPLSVARAFTRQELQAALSQAGLHPQIHWRWAFRYLVVGYV